MPVTSYAQVGEDLLSAYLLGGDAEIHYIDVGCLWPVEHSNTYYFYERGGRGLCIDANPQVGEEFRQKRPRDLFVNCGVGAEPAEGRYVMHGNPVFNTFSSERAREVERKAAGRAGRTVVEEISVPIKPLPEIVAETGALELLEGRVDLLSIDVEGLEAEVIRGADFESMRPRLVVVEHLRRHGEALAEVEMVQRLEGCGYGVAAYTGHDLYFVDRAR
jgi:FkbM family methyltransferase